MSYMVKENEKESLKVAIQVMREELDEIVIGDIDKNEILEFSQRLDDLINQYYSLTGT